MSLEIYPKDFSTRYGLYTATAISMSANYNDVGKIQIVEPLDDYAIASMKEGNIVYDTEHETSYIIVNVKCDTPNRLITANGYTAEWLLNQRCITLGTAILNIEKGVYKLVSSNLRGLGRVKMAPLKGLQELFRENTVEEEEDIVECGQLLDQITEVLDYGKLGRRMVWDSDNLEWTFEIYKGNDRTSGIHAVAFVEEHGTCSNLVVNVDESTYKNVAYIQYKYNDDIEVTSVGDVEGDERRELWVGTSVVAEKGESAKDVKSRAETTAALELGKYLKRTSFTVTIDAQDLGKKYNLGDTVACVSNRFGMAFQAQVTGWKYTLDSNGETTSIVLGEPTLTAIDEVIIKNGN